MDNVQLSKLLAKGIKSSYEANDYPWNPNFNLFAVRSANQIPDRFSDYIGFYLKLHKYKLDSLDNVSKEEVLAFQYFVNTINLIMDIAPLETDGILGNHTKRAFHNYQRLSEGSIFKLFRATTVPGINYLKKPLRSDGAMILKPGFIRKAYKIGFHKGNKEHLCLVQNVDFWVYRDNDKDELAEETKVTQLDRQGANMHRANKAGATTFIGLHSAGCQVFQVAEELDVVLQAAYYVEDAYHLSALDYALFREKELVL